MSSAEQTTPPPAATAKRPYVTPALVVHGDVQTITQTDPTYDQAVASVLINPQG